MSRKRLLTFTLSALTFAFTLSAIAAPGTQVSGERAVPSSKALQQNPAFRLASMADSAIAKTTLAPIPANEAAAIVAASTGDEKCIRVGVRRDVNAAAGAKLAFAPARWVIAGDGSQAMRVSLTSPGAQSLRLALSMQGLPANAEMRFAGTTAAQPVGPIAGSEGEGATRAQGLFWSPVTEGDTQTVEIWLPRGFESSAVRIEMRGASHIGARASDGSKLATGQGASGACEQDVACMTPMTEAFANAARSVAKMVFTEDGATYICSGTLLNDTDPSS